MPMRMTPPRISMRFLKIAPKRRPRCRPTAVKTKAATPITTAAIAHRDVEERDGRADAVCDPARRNRQLRLKRRQHDLGNGGRQRPGQNDGNRPIPTERARAAPSRFHSLKPMGGSMGDLQFLPEAQARASISELRPAALEHSVDRSSCALCGISLEAAPLRDHVLSPYGNAELEVCSTCRRAALSEGYRALS